MPQWNRLSLTLPLGLAVAAYCIPLRPVWSADSPPTAIQAALRVGPGESTPHFFTGDTQLSSFQRLPDPVPHPLQSAAVTAAPLPIAEQPPAEQPRPGLASAIINSVSTAQVPPQQAPHQLPPQQPVAQNEPLPPQPLADKPITWDREHEIDAHFFPQHSPLRFAAFEDSLSRPNPATLASEPPPPTPHLRSAEIRPVGSAQVAIVPPPQPPMQQPVNLSMPEPLPLPPAIGNSIVWNAEQRGDPHFFPKHNPTGFPGNFEQVSTPNQLAIAAPETLPTPRLRATAIQSVGAAQVAIAPAEPPPATALPPAPIQPAPRPTSVTALASAPVEPSAIRPTIALAPELMPPATSPPELAAPVAKTAAFESKRLAGPHFSLGPMRLASLERPPTNSQAPPLKEALVLPAAAPNLPPSDSVLPARQLTPPAPLAASPSPMKPQLTSLEARSPSSFNSPALAALPPPSPTHTPVALELTSLRISGPEPIAPLMPTAVLPAASPAPFHEQFQLTALQPLPFPSTNLQPTEVLPIPNPYNPAAPRVPTAIDVERPIGAVTSSIANTSGRLPTDLAASRFQGEYPPFLPRDWEDSVYFWDAPSMCIGPLRYEEVNLERYGYSHCPPIQPVLSGMKFLGNTLALPYSLAARPPGTCQYPLGHYRPGSPVPFRHIRPEFRPWPATVECMTIAGLILLIP